MVSRDMNADAICRGERPKCTTSTTCSATYYMNFRIIIISNALNLFGFLGSKSTRSNYVTTGIMD